MHVVRYPRPEPGDAQAEQQWLERRRSGIGGTDIGVIMGLSPWTSELKLKLEKLGKIVAEDSEKFRMARMHEVTIGRRFAEDHPELHPVTPGEHYVSVENPIIMGTPDFVGDGWTMDCKCVHPFAAKFWPEANCPQDIPATYYAQMQWQMMLTGAKIGYLCAMVDPYRVVTYEIEPEPESIEIMYNAAVEWWERYMIRNEEPPVTGHPADEEHLKRTFRGEKGLERDATEHEHALVLELHEHEVRAAEHEYYADQARNRIKAAMGDFAILNTPEGKIRWTPSERSSINWLDIATDKGATPEMIEEHTIKGLAMKLGASDADIEMFTKVTQIRRFFKPWKIDKVPIE